MPLTDLVHNLNKLNTAPQSWAKSASQFVSSHGRVFVHFANLRLESLFLPIIETATGTVHGHAAALRAYSFSTWQSVKAEAVFVLPSDDAEFVYLDRLVRTLHALNYLTHHIRGNLVLKVHPRHVVSVPADHGLAFEEILRPCGLVPEQITLELEIDAIEDTDHLKLAVHNYRARGYGIAIARFGRKPIDFKLLEELQPDLVKLDPLLLASARPLQRLIERLHQLGAKVVIEGVETRTLRQGAATLNIDLLQSHAPLRHLLHADPSANNVFRGERPALA